MPRASTVLNLYTIGDRVCAIGFEYGPASNYTIKRPFRLFSSDNGQSWTEPEYLQVDRQNVAIESHIVLDNGDWLFPAYFMEPRETPLEGGTRREYTHTIGCGVLISRDAGSTFLTDASGTIAFHGSIDNRPLGLHEPRLVQLSTGRVLMLMRANFDGRIWQAHSDDHGRTWSSAEPTPMPNPSAKVWIGRIGEGRIGLALNPATDKRDPLELWISDEDAKTWSSKLHLDEYRHYEHLTKPGERHDPEAGWGKGGAWPGNLSYPFVLVREHMAHVVYDVARRDVVLLRVALE